MVRRPAGGWQSVDRENSGWGDPAFEIADLLAHPSFIDVSAERQAWIINTYAGLSEQPEVGERKYFSDLIRVIRPFMLFVIAFPGRQYSVATRH